MSSFYLRKILIVLILVAVTVPACGSDLAPAMLRTTGEVSVNGVRSSKVSALFPRDVVQTTTESSASISARGTVIRVLPNSAIIWGEVLEVQGGSVEVGTKSGIAVTSEMYRFVPARKAAKFIVTRNNGCSYMSVQEGSVKVEGGKSVTVSAGGTFLFGEQKCAAPSPGVIGGNSASTARKAVALGGAGAAAVVTGVVLSGRPSISPSSPN